MVKIVRYFLAQ